MRRFYGYLTFVLTLILIVFANLQTHIQDLSSGIEYSGGYEILYKVDTKESSKSVDDIADIVVKRLEDANVQSSNVQAETGNDGDYIRIQMSGNQESEIDYALRSVETTGELTLSTLLDDANFSELENPFVVGSAKVDWSNSTPFVRVDVKDPKNFEDFVSNCNKDYEDFKTKYESDKQDSDDSVKGVMVIWLDKEQDDSYVQAYQNENEVTKAKIQERILAIVPTNNFYTEKNSNGDYTSAYLLISYYDFKQIPMVADSAHTVERIINYGAQDYAMTRLYTQRINATATSIDFYEQIVMWGLVVASIVLLCFLVVRFGLAGLTGWVAVITAMFAEIAFFNYFEYSISTIAIIGFVASLVLASASVIVYLSKFKNELYKGKTALKANQDASRNTLSNVIDVTLAGLLVSIVGILTFSSQIQLLPIVLCIGTVGSLIFTRLIMLFGMWWLTNNKLATNNVGIFMVKKEDVPDVMKMEPQRKFAPMSNIDPKRAGKKGVIIAGAVSAVCALLIAVFAIIPGANVFNDATESKTYSRAEIVSEYVNKDYLWQNKSDAEKFFAEKYPDLVINGIDINVVDNVISETSSENLVSVAYISVEFDGVIEDQNDAFADALLEKIKLEDNVDPETVSVHLVNCTAKSVNYSFTRTIVAVTLIAVLSIAFIFVRFGMNYALASLATFVPTILVALGFYSATRLPISSLSLAGIAAGLFIISIAHISLYERIKRMKREMKIKTISYEEKEEITIKSFKESIFAIMSIFGFALAATIVVALFSPLTSSVLSTYGTLAITIVIGAFATLLILVPVYLFLEKHIRFTFRASRAKRAEKNKKAMSKAKKANRNAGAEPEESRIPGINC